MENTKDFITRKMVADGICQGVIRFQKDPNLEDGPVCAIGDNWFYFGAEYTRPEEYLGTETCNRPEVETENLTPFVKAFLLMITSPNSLSFKIIFSTNFS